MHDVCKRAARDWPRGNGGKNNGPVGMRTGLVPAHSQAHREGKGIIPRVAVGHDQGAYGGAGPLHGPTRELRPVLHAIVRVVPDAREGLGAKGSSPSRLPESLAASSVQDLKSTKF